MINNHTTSFCNIEINHNKKKLHTYPNHKTMESYDSFLHSAFMIYRWSDYPSAELLKLIHRNKYFASSAI